MSATLSSRSSVKVWDTKFSSADLAERIYRDGVKTAIMDWSIEFPSNQDFDGRLQRVEFDGGSMLLSRMGPLIGTRTGAHIEQSPKHCFWLALTLAGELHITTRGITYVSKPGDVTILDSDIPLQTTLHSGLHQALLFSIPKSELTSFIETHRNSPEVVLPHNQFTDSLRNCISLAKENLVTSMPGELKFLFDASAYLLPLATGCFELAKEVTARERTIETKYWLKKMVGFINANISQSGLSPSAVAVHFGISERYVHKLFAEVGQTFSSFVTARRLEHIKMELLCSSSRRQIHETALCWGFKDISTFNRAFKKKFGCTPTKYRNRAFF